MIEKRKVSVVVQIEVEIDTDKLSYGVIGGAKDEDAIEEAVSFMVQETDYSFKIDESGINIEKVKIVEYSSY